MRSGQTNRSLGKPTSRNSLTMKKVLKINNDDGSYDVKHQNINYCIANLMLKSRKKIHETTCREIKIHLIHTNPKKHLVRGCHQRTIQ